jgi:CRP-like cAMP-binding protein
MKQVVGEIKSFSPQKIETGVTRKDVATAPEIHFNLVPGQVLFSQGDAGGDLYFIESGSIDIFISKKGQDIVLAKMGVGEVIGVMTLLTAESRLASARAKESTTVRKIPRSTITKLIATFPKWLNIVMKEFTIRINEMNRRYSETLIELKQVRENQITPLFLGTQMAQGLAVVGRGIAKLQDGRDMVVVDTLLESMERVLNQPREVTAGLWQVLRDSGLVEVESDGERKRDIVGLDQLEKCTAFSQFMRDAGQGTNKKLIKAKFRYKELLALIALVKLVVKQGSAVDKSVTIEVTKIAADFEKMAGTAWNPSFVDKAAKLGLMLVKGTGPSMALSFTPLVLGRTLGCLTAMKKLIGEDDSDAEAEAEPLENIPKSA